MAVRAYAEGTEVSVGKSRSEIDDMLQRWGCRQIAWANDYEDGRVLLQFVWRYKDQDYLARFAIAIPDEKALRERAVNRQTRRFSEPKFQKLCAGRGRAEHRQLALWLRACLVAVDAGIIKPEAVFFGWLVGRDGQTVWESAEPRLPELLSRGTRALLLPAGAA